MMKERTKVVLRHLPPWMTQAAVVDHIDAGFAGRYNWLAFHPATKSQKNQSYSRAYIDLKWPEDVVEFAEFFHGHLFVNEKGTQFRTIVEYAPSQRVPKQWSKKDGREGTILIDPEYLEFLEFLSKPVENLPSAAIQLERREAERAGAGKVPPVVTPLMDFIRQKRASKAGSRRPLSNGKTFRRSSGSSAQSPNSALTRRGSEGKRNSATMYVLRDAKKNATVKDGKSAYILVPKHDDQKPSEKSVTLVADRTIVLEEECGLSGINDAGKKKAVLLEGKVRDTFHMSPNVSQQQILTSSRNMGSSVALEQNQRRPDNGGDRSIFQKSAGQAQPCGSYSGQKVQSSNSERDKRAPRSQHVHLILKNANGTSDYKVFGNPLHGNFSENQEKRTRNKERPDRSVWTPVHRLDASSASDESLSSAFQPTQPSSEGSYNLHSCCGATHVKDLDGSLVVREGKHSKKGYGSHEKKVWVQKLSSGS